MNRVIKLSPSAILDLVKIYNYYYEDLVNPTAARKILDRIITDYTALKENPNLGFSLKKKLLINCDYRALACKRYLIFYRYINNQILISRILDSKRDYLKILFK